MVVKRYTREGAISIGERMEAFRPSSESTRKCEEDFEKLKRHGAELEARICELLEGNAELQERFKRIEKEHQLARKEAERAVQQLESEKLARRYVGCGRDDACGWGHCHCHAGVK